MNDTKTTTARIQGLDILRGVAILAMVVFHVAWDLYYFGYSPVDVTSEPRWVIFQKSILTTFMLLVGASLILAHGKGIRWRPFLKRQGFLVVAALLVTAGTYWMFPEYFVFFGVLHAIALFSLLALPLLGLDGRVILGLGVAIVAASFAYQDAAFTERTLAWIGFWPVSPPTSDVVPIFPWFGAVVIGMGLMQIALDTGLADRLRAIRSNEAALRGLAFLGRWSLLIYLLHQPLIIGVLYGLLQVAPPAPPPPAAAIEVPAPVTAEAAGFVASCQQSCTASGGEAGLCTRYCGCSLEQIEQNDLWAIVNDPNRGADGQSQLQGVAKLCKAMAE